MLKRNVFSLKFTVVCLVGISFLNSFATASSVSSSELSPGHCCSDLTVQGNATGIEVTERTLDIAHSDYNKDIPDHLDGNSTSLNQNVDPSTRNKTVTDEKELSLLSELSSKCQNASKPEDGYQIVNTKDENIYQVTPPYSILNDSGSIINSDNSLSEFINSSDLYKVLTNVLKQPNSNERNILEGITDRTEVSPEITSLYQISKQDTSQQYTTSPIQLIKTTTNNSLTEHSPQESSNYTFEIVLLNSNEQAQENNASRVLTYGSKNYYQLQTINVGHNSIKTTQNETHEESHSLNSSSILFDFLSIGNSTTQDVQNLFYNSSVEDLAKNESFSKNSGGNELLNKAYFYHEESTETSSETSVSSTTNHSLFADIEEITSSTYMPILNQVNDKGNTLSIASTTEHEVKPNISSELYFFRSSNGTYPATSPQENLTKTSSTTSRSFHDRDNETFHQVNITSPPLVSVVVSDSPGAISIKARALSTNTDMLNASTSGPVILKNVIEGRIVKKLSGSNNGITNATSNRESQSIGDSILLPTSSTEIYHSSSTGVMVDQVPSVILAVENNHPVSSEYSFFKQQYSSTIRSSTHSYPEHEHIGSSTSQTLEKANKILISANYLPTKSNETSAIVESVISTINDIVNQSRNDKILAHPFSDLTSNSIHQSESDNQQSNVFDHSLENNPKDPSSTQTIPATTATPELTTSRDGSKIFWKPLTNLLLSSQSPAEEEATTDRRIFWNLCFTKKPDLFSPRNPKETLMTNGPADTKVFWNLCPTKKPYIATPSYHPTEPSVSTSPSTASSPLSLFDIPNPSASGSSPEETPSQTTSSVDDQTTTPVADTTYVTFTEAAPEETTQ